MDLMEEMAAVIANLEQREWIQGTQQDGEAVCPHGAVMTCPGLRPGDEWIIRAVMRARGVTEGWNDEPGRTKDEVLASMATIAVSDDDLAATFGASWRGVVAVIRRAATLSVAEINGLAAAGDAAWAAAGAAARAAAWAAAGAAARDAAWAATGDAAGDAAWAATGDAAGDAAGDATWAAARAAAGAAARAAARAATTADLVGQHGLTQTHIDTLMGPWMTVLGADWAEEME